MLKNYVISIMFFAFAVLILPTNMAMAQFELPRISPKATVSQTIGITDVVVKYCRPGVKDRVIWGDLVPYEKIWRTGANEATTISFSTEVTVNDNSITKGEYSLFTIPSQKEWTVILNNNAGLIGTSGYEEKDDALRFKVKPQQAPFIERMMFYFENLEDHSANLVLHWEKLRIVFNIKADVNSLVMKAAKKSIGWRTPFRAARYVLDNNLNTKDGRRWLEVSLVTERNYWNSSLEAMFLAKEGKKKQAIQTMEKALDMAKSLEQPPFNLEQMASLLAEWKKK